MKPHIVECRLESSLHLVTGCTIGYVIGAQQGGLGALRCVPVNGLMLSFQCQYWMCEVVLLDWAR